MLVFRHFDGSQIAVLPTSGSASNIQKWVSDMSIKPTFEFSNNSRRVPALYVADGNAGFHGYSQ